MPYKLEFAESALREFRALDSELQRRISGKINQLCEAPMPSGVKKLRGPPWPLSHPGGRLQDHLSRGSAPGGGRYRADWTSPGCTGSRHNYLKWIAASSFLRTPDDFEVRTFGIPYLGLISWHSSSQ
jgi:hypothetical protein